MKPDLGILLLGQHCLEHGYGALELGLRHQTICRQKEMSVSLRTGSPAQGLSEPADRCEHSVRYRAAVIASA